MQPKQLLACALDIGERMLISSTEIGWRGRLPHQHAGVAMTAN